jgi:hypothetical protein
MGETYAKGSVIYPISNKCGFMMMGAPHTTVPMLAKTLTIDAQVL